MSRYFIHIENGTGGLVDDIGSEWASPALAIGEAAKMAGEILRDDTRDRLSDYRVVLRVVGEAGDPIGDITMALSLATPT